MRKLFAPVLGILALVVAIFFLSYVVPPLFEFLAWWFLTKETITAPLSTGQAVLIDVITHAITYISVGVLFGFLGWWNSDAMHVVYVIGSEVISLLLALLLRFIIDYYWILFIVLGLLVVAAIVLFILAKKKEKKEELCEDKHAI